MTDHQWRAIVVYVLGCLENEQSFDVDAMQFAERFELPPDYWNDLLIRRDYPAPRLFEAKSVVQSEMHLRRAIHFEWIGWKNRARQNNSIAS